MKKSATSFWSSLWQLFFPPLCYSCGRVLQHYENTLCLQCEISLPESHFAPDKPNPMQQRLAEHVPVEFATALFLFYPQGKIEQLLYQLKYKGQEKLSAYFGRWAARELPPSLFRQCTAVIPMPLHTKRQHKRGYNQVQGFAEKWATDLGIPLRNDVVWRKKNTRQLASGKVKNRWEEVQDAFAFYPITEMSDNHWLLVDDVMTSGASLCACAKTLLQIPRSKISIVTIAYRK